MNGGVTYCDMERRKASEAAVERLEAWLKEQTLAHDVLSPGAISTIRQLLTGAAVPDLFGEAHP